jgi:hypothetical protein
MKGELSRRAQGCESPDGAFQSKSIGIFCEIVFGGRDLWAGILSASTDRMPGV